MRQWRGFTLIEVMIVVAVLGLLLALAVPSFTEMGNRNKLTSSANDLIIAFLSARSEAVKRECEVQIVRTGSWGDGWRARVRNTIAGCPNNLEILRHETASANMIITPNGNINNSITFTPDGRTTIAIAGSFGMTLGNQAKAVCVTINGRPYVPEDGLPGMNLTQWLALCP